MVLQPLATRLSRGVHLITPVHPGHDAYVSASFQEKFGVPRNNNNIIIMCVMKVSGVRDTVGKRVCVCGCILQRLSNRMTTSVLGKRQLLLASIL